MPTKRNFCMRWIAKFAVVLQLPSIQESGRSMHPWPITMFAWHPLKLASVWPNAAPSRIRARMGR
eukprot:scaffold51772_cov35-Phaeocystis_antarctica.AAC.2